MKLTWNAGLLLVAIAACSPSGHAMIMKRLTAQLSSQFHECVPLGWNPVPVDASSYYVRGESAEAFDRTPWPARWIGWVQASDRRPSTQAIAGVLNEFVKQGLLARIALPGGYRYHLTVKAIPYYYDDSRYSENPLHLPYLCYATIRPERVVWNQPVHLERSVDPAKDVQVFRTGFDWQPGPSAAWANDTELQAHSVILAPVQSPAVAKFANLDGTWIVVKIYAPVPTLPRVADRSAWSRLR